MAAEQPKKVTGGAFGRFLAAKRLEIVASMPQGHKITEIPKKASELWKALADSEKQPYEKLYKEAQAAYVASMATFQAEGGVAKERKSKKDKEKKKKDKDAPKRPAGGAYGRFMAEKRQEIMASLGPKDNKITDTAKKAGALWKAASASEKQKYEKLYEEQFAAYKKAMEEYKATGGGEDTEQTASPVAKAGTKRKAAYPAGPAAKNGKLASHGAPAAKKGKAGRPASKRTVEQPAGLTIGDKVLAEAEKVGYESQLKNMAGRSDVIASGKSDKDLLKALKDSGGLVNPARRALLGA